MPHKLSSTYSGLLIFPLCLFTLFLNILTNPYFNTSSVLVQEVTDDININHVNKASLHKANVQCYSLMFLARTVSFSFFEYLFFWTVTFLFFSVFVSSLLTNAGFYFESYKT